MVEENEDNVHLDTTDPAGNGDGNGHVIVMVEEENDAASFLPLQQQQVPTSFPPPAVLIEHASRRVRATLGPIFGSQASSPDDALHVLEDISEESRKRPRRDPLNVGKPSTQAAATLEGSMAPDECIICMDAITAHGTHRAACLVCGHIFGHECIEKWLKTTEKEKRVCPQCKQKAKESDIRLLYTSRTTLCVADNSEMHAVRTDLSRVRDELRQTKEKLTMVEREQQMVTLRVTATQEENRRLAREAGDLKLLIEEYKRQFGLIGNASSAVGVASNEHLTGQPPVRYGLFLELMREYKDASARVMTFCSQQTILVISQKLNALSHGPFGKNSGLKMVSCMDFNTSELMPLPTGLIRDISVNDMNGYALIGSMDKSIAIVSLNHKSIVHKYQEELPVWSCAWNSNVGHFFYCGLSDGSVSIYDIRNLSARVCRLSPPHGTQNPPAFQVTYVDRQPNHKFPQSGLIVSSANRCGFYTATSAALDRYEYYDFPQIGSQFATTYHRTSRMLARSYRPDQSCKYIRHSMEELNYSPTAPTKVHLNTLHSVTRGTNNLSMYRGAFLTVGEGGDEMGDGEMRLAIPDESQKALLVWDLMDKSPRQTLRTPQLALDVCQFAVGGKPLSAVLMEKGLQIYSCRPVC